MSDLNEEQFEHEAMLAMEEDERGRSTYIKAGICEGCGATCREEAERMCKPYAIGETGEYGCAGEDLWPEEY